MLQRAYSLTSDGNTWYGHDNIEHSYVSLVALGSTGRVNSVTLAHSHSPVTRMDWLPMDVQWPLHPDLYGVILDIPLGLGLYW